jgi:hypothetical protein
MEENYKERPRQKLIFCAKVSKLTLWSIFVFDSRAKSVGFQTNWIIMKKYVWPLFAFGLSFCAEKVAPPEPVLPIPDARQIAWQ